MSYIIDILSLLQNIELISLKDNGDAIKIVLNVMGKPALITIEGDGLENVRFLLKKIQLEKYR